MTLGNLSPSTQPVSHALQNWYEYPDQRLNSLIENRFRLKKVLGVGAYAVTYLAEDRSRQLVVVKIYYIRPGEDKVDKVRRFVMENIAYEALKDQNGFVKKRAEGRSPAYRPEEVNSHKAEKIYRRMCNGTDYYLVMQYMAGGSLYERLGRGPLSPHEAAQIIISVGQAVERAHTRNIILRDVKPGNILFDERDVPYVSDLGTVLFLSADDPQARTTVHAGFKQPLGTPGYIPPETYYQKQETVQRDVFALGMTLLVGLVGNINPPQRVDPLAAPEMYVAAVKAAYSAWRLELDRALHTIPNETLRNIATRAIAFNCRERYQTVHQLVLAMQEYVGPVQSVQPGERANALQSAIQRDWPGAVRVIRQVRPAPANPGPSPFSRVQVWFRNLPDVQRQRLNFMLCAWLTTWYLFTRWPDFYGPWLNVILPLSLGCLFFVSPFIGMTLAIGAVCLLMIALSPVLGLTCAVIMFVTGKAIWGKSTESQFVILSPFLFFALALPFSVIGATLALPIVFGLTNRDPKRSALAGLGLFCLLSIWATLQGTAMLGATILIDVHHIVTPWVLDTTAATFIHLEQLISFLNKTSGNPVQAAQFARLTWTLWTLSPAPALGALAWGITGACASLIRARTPISRRSSWSIILITIVVFLGIYIPSSILMGAGQFIGLVELAFNVIVAALVASLWVNLQTTFASASH